MLPADWQPSHNKRSRSSTFRDLGRSAERRLRFAARKSGRISRSFLDGFISHDRFDGASSGDLLLMAGENWNHYDFDVLRQLRSAKGIRIAAVLQDMAPHLFPQFYGGHEFAERFRLYADFLERDTDLVLAVSNSTRDDFLAYAARSQGIKERVSRITLGSDLGGAERKREPVESLAASRKPFILSVSTIQARKNFELLYRLWQKFSVNPQAGQPSLVIVGRPGYGSRDLLESIRNDPAIANTVTLLHGPSDAQLAWLYANCLFTLYPSWYEGWGLPLAESLSHNKTFIASDRSSLPEAGQGLGVHIDPFDLPAPRREGQMGLGVHIDPFDLPAWEREILDLAGNKERRSAMEKRIRQTYRPAEWRDCACDIMAAIGLERETRP